MIDVWDIPSINNMSSERLGYPTQKPMALLERIIKASTNEGDFVLDPFCGCGTTIAAANKLGRRWAGIDMSPLAIDLVKYRRLRDASVPVLGVPVDVESAAKMAKSAPFAFEKWAVTRIPGLAPNDRQTGDRDIDGRGCLHGAKKEHGLVLAQVKGGKFNLSHLRDFVGVMAREKGTMGIYITLDHVESRETKTEARQMGEIAIGARTYPKLQLWSIADHFEGREPKLPPLADPYTGKAMQMDILAR